MTNSVAELMAVISETKAASQADRTRAAFLAHELGIPRQHPDWLSDLLNTAGGKAMFNHL